MIGITNSRAVRILMSLRWLALALFIVALAQPRFVLSETQVRASGIDMVVSSSMMLKATINSTRVSPRWFFLRRIAISP